MNSPCLALEMATLIRLFVCGVSIFSRLGTKPQNYFQEPDGGQSGVSLDLTRIADK